MLLLASHAHERARACTGTHTHAHNNDMQVHAHARTHYHHRKRGVSRSRGPAAARALVVLAVLLLAVRGAHGAECSGGGSLPCTFGGSGGCNFFLDADEFLDRTGSCPAQGGDLWLDRRNIKGLKPDVFDNMGAVTVLYLHGNAISALPVGVFDKLTSLE